MEFGVEDVTAQEPFAKNAQFAQRRLTGASSILV
jgi:hypothetical protein